MALAEAKKRETKWDRRKNRNKERQKEEQEQRGICVELLAGSAKLLHQMTYNLLY
jgi:hypothetical protein